MLRGALLGAGNIAQHGHLPAYLNASELAGRCQIIAAADLGEENLAQVARQIPGLQTFHHPNDLLASVHPDFVDICTPPSTHREIIELAAEAGCHILCEKPLALTLGEALAIRDHLGDRGVVFLPGHQYHYSPAWQAIRTALCSGAIGTPAIGVVEIERQRANNGNLHWCPSWRTHAALSGGGILMDHGAHLFYQLQSVFGQLRRVAACTENRRHRNYGVEDTAYCYLEYQAITVRARLTWASRRRRTLHRYFGSTGQIESDESGVRILPKAGAPLTLFDQGFSNDSSHSGWYVSLIKEFFDRIEQGNYDRAPLEEAVSALRCAGAAYEAARTHQAVVLPSMD